MFLFFSLKFNRTIEINFQKKIISFLVLSLIFIILFSCEKNKIIFINGKKLYIEVVDTDQTRRMGLMFRKQLAPDAGMLFVFEKNSVLSFWMKNTFIPLSIAFIDTNYMIVRKADMSPLDEETLHSSVLPVKYALEVNQGWFEINNIKINDKISNIAPFSK